MSQTTQHSGISFEVDEVKPAAQPLEVCTVEEALSDMLPGGIESCSGPGEPLVTNVDYQPLLAAVYLAFSQHRPLVLTPDSVWLTIAQGLAHHMAIHGERLRPQFVAHQRKVDLVIKVRDWQAGSPDNPWAKAFYGWAGQIRDHIGQDLHDLLICDFSTSGPVERAASQVAMMDIFDRYFHYSISCICGIPSVTLEGTTADWQLLAQKVARLRLFDMNWWLDPLQAICHHFVRASSGDVDLKFWQSICKLREAYGGNIINGWIAKLFPYLRAFVDGPCNRRNPIFENGEGFQTFAAPGGLSRVPLLWRDDQSGQERLMEVIGGLIGVSQNRETLALRPKVGWAVREAPETDVLYRNLSADHMTFPGFREEGEYQESELPADMANFYHYSNGAKLFVHDNAAAFEIPAQDSIEPLRWWQYAKTVEFLRPDDRPWHQFGWLSDGTWLAVNLDPNRRHVLQRDPGLKQLVLAMKYPFAPICHGSDATKESPGSNPVIALSFTELLKRLLASDGNPYWLEPNFVSYGDADRFTRRR